MERIEMERIEHGDSVVELVAHGVEIAAKRVQSWFVQSTALVVSLARSGSLPVFLAPRRGRAVRVRAVPDPLAPQHHHDRAEARNVVRAMQPTAVPDRLGCLSLSCRPAAASLLSATW